MELQLLWERLLWFPWSYGDPHRLPWPVSDSRHDTDMTEPNALRLIYLARPEHKNKQTKKDSSFPFYSPLTRTSNKWILSIFSEFSWKIVFTKITSHISKPSSVFDKLGLGSKYRRNSVSAHSCRVKKKSNVTGEAEIKSLWQRQSPPSTWREKRGDCKLAWISAVPLSRKLLFRLGETSEISGYL